MREQLLQLAMDLWWTTQPEVHRLWHDLDPERWCESQNNPIVLLRETDLAHAPPGWTERASALLDRWRAYHARPMMADAPTVAYFSMEFGLHESLPIYSGGLGMLAGDHLRSASDLGLPLVAVGLFYHEGYFKQLLHDGRQVAAYTPNQPDRMPMRPVFDPSGRRLSVYVPHGNHFYAARAWVVTVGRVQLYLLDTDFEGNGLEHRVLTRQLYGGNQETRLAQEVLLGIGGVRLLTALGVRPQVFHMNEGHAAFALLELWAQGLDAGLDREEAWRRARARSVFTTHTPVEAGHDRFSYDLVTAALGGYRESLGLQPGSFMDRGRVRPGDIHEPLCMTVLAMRGSRQTNGVSELHAEVSRHMWRDLGLPVRAITNGVHPTAWLAPETVSLFDEHLPGWRERVEDRAFWEGAESIPEQALLAVRDARRKRLVREVRRLTGREIFNESRLTIGFARRFAPYKRGNLLFTDPDRFAAFLEKGVQVVFAGKAHPQDLHGQALLSEVVRWTRDPRFRRNIVFLPDYDATLGRLLTQGCDVWLNTPRRPREASGTSGQKAALNGNLNCSILDGWWPEAFDGRNGWTIGTGKILPHVEDQDRADAEAMYETLETEVLPAFHTPAKWARLMAHTIASCFPEYNTSRMVRQYLDEMYRN